MLATSWLSFVQTKVNFDDKEGEGVIQKLIFIDKVGRGQTLHKNQVLIDKYS